MESNLAKLAEEFAKRPLVPTDGGAPTLHVGENDLPYLDAGDGSALQLLHVDLNAGLWISKVRMRSGYRVVKHFHTGSVFAVTLQGRWYYAESPEAMNAPGSYLFEPAGSVHTLCVPEDQEGDTVVWFAVNGANINLDADGKVVSVVDARFAHDGYTAWCKALGHDTSKLVVIGG